MQADPVLSLAISSAPPVLMAALAVAARCGDVPNARLWRWFQRASIAALLFAALGLALRAPDAQVAGVLALTTLSAMLAVLVQGLGTVIGSFSTRYLDGEAGQRRYIAALAAVLAAVQLFLMADHWLLLIAAWAGVGLALQSLLCFYPTRPFALLAAHKKRLADRLADALLLGAAALAWGTVGNGTLSGLWRHIAEHGMSAPLQAAAVALVLAVILRSALLPVHGWLIQVMEAPTPVSALLHAGVVNLGGFVLIRFAPLLEQASAARTLLALFGLASAVLAGMVMLTRISIKVRLAWSTVAQMGFMLLECALGLYTLAALHLVGHSLYKAHAFLSASAVVRQTRLRALRDSAPPHAASLLAAPVLATAVVAALTALATPGGHAPWPWWWTGVLGLAWAPLLWLRAGAWRQVVPGVLMVAGLAAAALLAHALPLGLADAPQHGLGWAALAAMAVLYLCQALLQQRPAMLAGWRRSSYAGFYLDEAYTRLALRLWPARWTADAPRAPVVSTLLADVAP